MVTIVYTPMEKIRIKTGADLKISDLQFAKDNYTRDWQIRTKDRLERLGCPKIIIARALAGKYKSQRVLKSHLELEGLSTMYLKVWEIIK